MNKVSVSIPGGNGRMGRTLIGLITENLNYELASSTCLPGEDEDSIYTILENMKSVKRIISVEQI